MAHSPFLGPESQLSSSPPYTRDSSPSPSISATPPLSACPEFGRSFSTTSSDISSLSRPSTTSRSSSASAALRQRGYVRPQGVSFAASAGNRDSVLSLGSIAHLQYYFARTGLLDGKGGQLARDQGKRRAGTEGSLNRMPKKYIMSEEDGLGDEDCVVDEDSNQDPDENVMLPPTVSTYSHKVPYIPPPPDSETLREELKKSLMEAGKALEEVETTTSKDSNLTRNEIEDSNSADMKPKEVECSSGWYEIQGLHVLDVVTLAIRAAKIYYTAHEHPQRLYSIKSERQIREELLTVMDVLKRMASRNFAGGMKEDELSVISKWVKGIDEFVIEEQAMEAKEVDTRGKWQWLDGSWGGQERKRERLFMCSFLPNADLPDWTSTGEMESHPSPFLQALRNGLTLVHLHNAVLQKSKRQFGDIKTYHTDTTKPYRCAENLRYWIKAAEIRWEIKIKVNVTGVVHGRSEAWPDFEAAILQWCQAVREEITKEWKEGTRRISSSMPDPPGDPQTQRPTLFDD
ncbi:MAG: hypothetical protein Q9195_000160 [Heterodermia aff. obscurata]